MQGSPLEIRYFERRLSKVLWKVKLFFLLNPVPFNGKVIKNKSGLELVTSRSSGYETSSQKFLYYLLSDQVKWCNIKRFSSYSENYTSKFMQANSWHHKLYFHLLLWIWRMWKGRGEITISRGRNELFRWNKKHFS